MHKGLKELIRQETNITVPLGTKRSSWWLEDRSQEKESRKKGLEVSRLQWSLCTALGNPSSLLRAMGNYLTC